MQETVFVNIIHDINKPLIATYTYLYTINVITMCEKVMIIIIIEFRCNIFLTQNIVNSETEKKFSNYKPLNR